MIYKINPIIILGAPRSGTNMLRDLICQYPKFTTWNCDEINPIWKYKNYNKSDELKSDDLNDDIVGFIKNQFYRISNGNQLNVIEKTCANSLRPGFVNSIFPNAKFLFIYRNGYDCVVSAKKKKQKRFDLKYQIKKLKYSPLISYPFLLKEKLFTNVWGPRYNGIDNDIINKHELEVVSKQWMKCNSISYEFLSTISKSNYLKINYDTFVSNPKLGLIEIINFLEIPSSAIKIFNINHIFNSSIGNSENILKEEEKFLISKYIDEFNQKLNL